MLRFTPPIAVFVALLLTAVTGCGGSSSSVPSVDYGSDEGRKIAEFVDYFNDHKADPNKFKKAFAGSAPSNWKEYEPLRYAVKADSLKVEGTTTTATVNMSTDSSHEVVATKEWAFTKVGDEWKLKSAPLR